MASTFDDNLALPLAQAVLAFWQRRVIEERKKVETILAECSHDHTSPGPDYWVELRSAERIEKELIIYIEGLQHEREQQKS